jgi:F0F1-type ATP synthase assembly protein I
VSTVVAVDVLLGVFAIAVGALFCFRGYLTMRVIIPIWGAFAGFFLGAGVVAGLGSERFLSSVAAWVVGLVTALVFGVLAYLYYEVSVVLAMTAVGFTIGTSVMVAIGVTWSWVIILVGVLTGALLAAVAIVGDLPMVLLTVLTAMAGSSVIVAGTMLLAGTINNEDLSAAITTERLGDNPWWYAVYLLLAIAGVVVQFRSARSMEQTMRESWASDGGREIRRS